MCNFSESKDIIGKLRTDGHAKQNIQKALNLPRRT